MPRDLDIPRYGTPFDRLLPWLLEAQQEGTAWLQSQRPTQEWERALQTLSESTDATPALAGVSNLGYNKTKRVARELVAGLSDFRHEGEFKVTWNEQLYDQAHQLTKLDEAWYDSTHANAVYREGMQYAVATGTAYFMQTWDKHFWSPYRGDIRLSAIAPGDVTFVQLPKDHNIQRAYAVIIREEMPINLARAAYADLDNGRFAASLAPDRDAPGWLQRGLRKLQQFVAPALRVAGRSQQQQQGSFPTVDIFHMYTLDSSINDGPAPRQMGMPGTNWAYTVPAIDDPINTEVINPQTGNYFTRPAGREDCLLFPLRRYTIFSRTAVGYDGSSPYWHGQVPLTRLRFCDWAWEALGSSLIGDLKTMQDGIVALMQGIENAAAARLDPPMLYDDQIVDKTWAQAFNPNRAGSRAAAPLSQGEVIKFPVPPEYYNVPAYIPEWIRSQEDRMDYMAGVKDLTAFAKAQQIPGADTIEKLMELAGPIVRDNLRALEKPLQELGEQRKALYFQFYTKARMITVTGPEGVRIDVKYEPSKLIPILPQESPEARQKRARGYLEDFRYQITESGISEFNRMSEKLLMLQLAKVGFPIDWWTLARVMKIPNFGPPPEGTNTVMERWVAQKQIEVDQAINQQMEVAQAGAAMAAAGAGGGGGEAPAPGGGAPGGGDGPGRPPSFSAAPRLETKDGGTRTTVATSEK